MRSYILAIAFSMLLSAIYVFQNTGDIYVRFLMFEREFPQGVWEVLLFSVGAVIMWLFSIFASLEMRSKNSARIKERDKKISQLEEEKNSLLAAFKHMAPSSESAVSESVFMSASEPASAPEVVDGEKESVSI